MTPSLPSRANRLGLEGIPDDEARETSGRADHWRAKRSGGGRIDRRSQTAAKIIGADNLQLEGQNGVLNEDQIMAYQQQRRESSDRSAWYCHTEGQCETDTLVRRGHDLRTEANYS